MAGLTQDFTSMGTMGAPKMQNWVCLSPFQFYSLRQKLSRGEINSSGIKEGFRAIFTPNSWDPEHLATKDDSESTAQLQGAKALGSQE